MYGAIFGDILGSYYELHCTKSYNFEFQNDSSYTDDTVLTAAVCDAILYNSSELARFGKKQRAIQYAARYKSYCSRYASAGFGSMFREWSNSDTMRVQHSYANGGAMRVVPIGYAYRTLEQVQRQVRASCFYTHHHKEAINGAMAVASAVYLAYHGSSKENIRNYIKRKFQYSLSQSVDEMRYHYKFDSRTAYSVPPAITAFLESTGYEDAVRKAISLGGDADTMACISGGIAEAYYKEIPSHIKTFCMKRIDGGIKQTVNQFYSRFCPELKV